MCIELKLFHLFLILVDKLLETLVEGPYFQDQEKYTKDSKCLSCEVFHQVLSIRLAGEGPCFSDQK